MASAVPSKMVPLTANQPDGTSVAIKLIGDEHSHIYVTEDGIPVAFASDGSLYYVIADSSNLTLSDRLAHEQQGRTLQEAAFVSRHSALALETFNSRWRERASKSPLRQSIRVAAKGGAKRKTLSYTGEKRGLVILVNFANKEMSRLNAHEVYNQMFNATGYSEDHAVGSVSDYFYDQSYGTFRLSFDVVGPFTVSHDYGYYGGNTNAVDGNDKRPGEMIKEACLLADDFVDFSQYDWNGDGEVEQVFVVYAGYGEASGGESNTIWPHEHSLEYTDIGKVALDGVVVNTYACSSELDGGSGTQLCGIGTACHEFSHCLGLPDFYDTSYKGGFGMGYWDVMASGAHSGPNSRGEIPVGYSAYERWFAGWLELEELNTPCIVKDMSPLSEEARAYAIYNDGHRNEFFIAENRQAEKWFSYVGNVKGCHGLLLYHVDYDQDAWNKNSVNNVQNHQRMTIVPADRSYGNTVSNNGRTYYTTTENELCGDLFPGLAEMEAATDSTHLGSGLKLNHLNSDGTYRLGKPITDITEEDGLVSFYFMGGIYVPTPSSLSADRLSASSFKAVWIPSGDADSYDVELYEYRQQPPPQQSLVLSENMQRFTTRRNSGDGYVDLSAQLDSYMQNAGWSGQKVFTSQYGAKIGTSNVQGHITSPTVQIRSNNLTISVSAHTAFFVQENRLQVVLETPSGDDVITKEVCLSNERDEYVISFENVTSKVYRLKITSVGTMYVSGVTVYDGLYSANDIDRGVSEHYVAELSLRVDNIKDCFLEFNDLTAMRYSFRVRAVCGGIHSRWSNYQDVMLGGYEEVVSPVLLKQKEGMPYDLLGRKTGGTPVQGVIVENDSGNWRKKMRRP